MAAESVTVPNRRFLENKCTDCAVSGVSCHHTPFGRLFPWQLSWLGAFDSARGGNEPVRKSFLEIHRRGRKTSTAINLQFRECDLYPKTRHVYVGPTFAESRRIVWDDPTMLKEALPDRRVLDWKLNEQHMIVRFGNGSIWQCFGGEDPDALHGVDYQSAIFDEWALANPKCWTEALQPIFRQSLTRWVAFIYTPKGYNHATRMFDDAAYVNEGDPLPNNGPAARCKPGTFALRLSAEESGIIPAAELEQMKNDPLTPLAHYQQEFLCARIAEEQFSLITSADLEKLWRERERPTVCAAIIACDPSMGGDACAISAQWGPLEITHKSFRTRDTMRIVGELRRVSDETGIMDFIVDSIGIGQGIADRLMEDRRYQVQAFNSSEQSSQPDRRANKRADMWWEAREDVVNTECVKPGEETCRQIPFASRYKIGSNGKIQIVLKDKIKEDLGRSPDDAEAWAMGRYGLRRARQCAGKMSEHVVRIWTPYQQDENPYGNENPAWFGRGKRAPF